MRQNRKIPFVSKKRQHHKFMVVSFVPKRTDKTIKTWSCRTTSTYILYI
nr:MAG TPA: hypothetical protein [Caudoviricetes sp.]